MAAVKVSKQKHMVTYFRHVDVVRLMD